ncbi:phage tail tube protein [Paremcibacter congregatus]|uniref:phage tail tube protein n=1 Tax=Paremcibacter congregatus TaxID=2043170 RepID=UPI003A8F4115
MTKETAKHCLLYVGDGGAALVAATTYGLTVSGSTITLTDSADGFVDDGIEVGDQLTVVGFADNPSFTAIAMTVAIGSIVLKNPVNPDTRQDVTLVTEAAGESVTLTVEGFDELLGQATTNYSKSAAQIDFGDKNSGNFNPQGAGTVTMDVSVDGKVEFTEDGTHGGWTALNDAVDAGTQPNCRLVLNSARDSYYGPFSISSQDGGGGKDDPNAYSFSLSVAARPVYVTGFGA